MDTSVIKTNFFFLILNLIVFQTSSHAQEPNIFYSKPDEIKKFLIGDYKKIEIQIVDFQEIGPEKIRMPYISGNRAIIFFGDTLCIIKNLITTGGGDTTYYKYDHYGNILEVSDLSKHQRYINKYNNTNLISRESYLESIWSGRRTAALHTLTKFVYDINGKLKTELNYNFPDTINIKGLNEYYYTGNLIDSIKDFYFEDGEKVITGLTKYFYSSKLDSIIYKDAQTNFIDKIEYKYYPSGKISTILGGRMGQYNYSYNVNQDPQVISEGGSSRYFFIKYFE